MGVSTGIAINEGVALLDNLSPERLSGAKMSYPALAPSLVLGIDAGGDEGFPGLATPDPLLEEKARFMVDVLTEAQKAAEGAHAAISARIRSARRQRLVSQALVIVGSSSSLATLALSKNTAAVIAAVLTVLAALGNLIAEYQEKLLSPEAGNIYDVFQRLGEGAYKARSIGMELTLALKYQSAESELKTLVGSANDLAEKLNGWLIQLLNKIPSSAKN